MESLYLTLDDLEIPNQDLLDQLYNLDSRLLAHMDDSHPLTTEELNSLQEETRRVQEELDGRHQL